jgi:hypothetical protein
VSLPRSIICHSANRFVPLPSRQRQAREKQADDRPSSLMPESRSAIARSNHRSQFSIRRSTIRENSRSLSVTTV